MSFGGEIANSHVMRGHYYLIAMRGQRSLKRFGQWVSALLPASGQRVSEVRRRVRAERVRVCLSTGLVEFSILC